MRTPLARPVATATSALLNGLVTLGERITRRAPTAESKNSGLRCFIVRFCLRRPYFFYYVHTVGPRDRRALSTIPKRVQLIALPCFRDSVPEGQLIYQRMI